MPGTDLPYRQFHPSTAKVGQVDVRGENLGRRTTLTLGLGISIEDIIETPLPFERPWITACSADAARLKSEPERPTERIVW